MSFGIYIHIPYCLRKCPYCSFPSIPVLHPPEDAYVKALKSELGASSSYIEGRQPCSIYIGGGTPSLFSPDSIENILTAITNVCVIPPDAEITLEANPGTISLENLKGYLQAGVNRLSVGLQSLMDRRLKTLGRIHNSQEALECVSKAREAGFTNISVDFIFGTPGQCCNEWEEELNEIVHLGPEHISAYELTLEKETPFYEWVEKRTVLLPDEETLVSLHRATWRTLSRSGYEHYEVSNFALPGRRSRHNQIYWDRGEYLGLGAGSHTFLHQGQWGVRRWNIKDPEAYMRMVSGNGQAVQEEESLTREQAMTEALFLGLRLINGMAIGKFEELFGTSILEAFPGVAGYLDIGLLTLNGGRLAFTEDGLLLSDRILQEIP